MKKVAKKISSVLTILFLVLTDVILCVLFYTDKYLGKVDFYQILHLLVHTETDDQGVMTVIYSGIQKSIPLFLFLICIEIVIFIRWKKTKVVIINKKKKKKYSLIPGITAKFRLIFSLVLLLLTIYGTLKYIKYDEYVKIVHSNTYIYDQYYVDTNKVKIDFKNKKRNLILIYLESMESSLFSEENNGSFEESRIPELEQLAMDNISFSHTDGLGGRYNSENSTIATLLASTSATPIQNKISEVVNSEHIIPNIRTLSDVLSDEGYNIEFIQGSEASFCGTDIYLKDHGYDKILDYKEAKRENLISYKYHVWWGFEDAKLFKFAKTEISELAKKDEPFAVTLFTIDTHFLDGYLDDSCETPFPDQMSNVFHCSSKMTYDFVEWIQDQDFYEDTMIVLIGDHLTHQETYYDKDNKNRYVYNVFINSKKQNVKTNNRIFTNYDVYPTVLSGLGATIDGNKIGLGVNLFSNESTLAERIGYDYLMQEKNKHSNYYEKYID